MNSKQISQIILNVTLVSCFIGVLFFTYGSKVEQEIIQEQTENITKSITGDLQFLPDSLKQQIKEQLSVPNMESDDLNAKESNSKLLKKSALVLGILFLVGMLLTIIIYITNKIDENIFTESLVILLAVGLTEVLFLNIISRPYKIADPNFVKYSMLSNLQTLVNT